MTVSNRDRAIFNRFSAAMEENARQDKSAAAKEFRKEREAWEKAAGGKQKLEQADAEYTRRIAAGDAKAKQIIHISQSQAVEAAKEIAARKRALDERDKQIVAKRTLLGTLAKDNELKEQGLAVAGKALALAEAAVEERDAEQDRRDAALNARDTENTRREAEIKRFDAWRATAPA